MASTIPLPHRVRGRKAPPLVLVHGFGGDRLAWNGLMPRLSQLRRTIAVDLPGHGAAVDWPETPDASACATALVATLEALNVERAVLIGHSMGGAVAGIVGLTRPDLVERLVLLAPGGFGPEMNVRLLRRYAHATEEREIALVLEQFFGPTSPVPEQLPRLAFELRTEALRRSLMAIVERIVRGDGQGTMPLDKLAAAPFPVTLVWGLEDAVLPVRQALEAPPAFARHLLPGVGHMPHLEAPELTHRIIAQAVCGRLE